MTDRILIQRTGPSTNFYAEADVVDLGVIYGYLRAVNAGNTTSRDLNSGWQAMSVDGYGEFARHSANPFLPSGVANGAWRWRLGPYGIYVGDPAGGVTLRQTLYYGNTATAHIPIQPQAPSPVWYDSVQATSFRYMFSGRGNGGAGILGWEAQLATSPGFEAWSIVSHVVSSGTTLFSNLNPGTKYWARSRGRNGVGLGWWSAAIMVETLSGARVFYNGAYRHAIAHVWTAGGWKRAIPHVFVDGAYRLPR